MTTNLVYNTKNAVTFDLQRSRWQGRDVVVKTLSGINPPDVLPQWQASSEPTDWNYWRREYCVYSSSMAAWMAPARVRLPQLYNGELAEDRIIMTLEDVGLVTGNALAVSQYPQIVRAWGCAQGHLSRTEVLEEHWTSRQFLRRYVASKPVSYDLLNDVSAWAHPLIREQWPEELREGLQYLYAHHEQLLEILESQVQVPSHLDFWPNNILLDANNQVVLIDWGFFGAGAWGEDLGNFIPDAVFDGFVSAAAMLQIEQELMDEYLRGVHSSGAELDADQLQRNVYASAVKYVWLGPLLLEQAQLGRHAVYGGAELTDAAEQYYERGQCLLRLCSWAQEALKR